MARWWWPSGRREQAEVINEMDDEIRWVEKKSKERDDELRKKLRRTELDGWVRDGLAVRHARWYAWVTTGSWGYQYAVFESEGGRGHELPAWVVIGAADLIKKQAAKKKPAKKKVAKKKAKK